MSSVLRPALVILGLFTLMTGALYPVTFTAVAKLLFPGQAEGSLVRRGGRVVGSALIGQSFDGPRYFWSRPSATAPRPYDASASTGSNLGPSNPALLAAVRKRVTHLRAAGPAAVRSLPVPVDLVTASASGLDPDISPAAALFQVPRVARARGLPEGRVRELLMRNVEARPLGLLGERRVNVLRLNLALDSLSKT